MGQLSRRGFLLGSSAAVVAAATAPAMTVLPAAEPIFDGFIGEWNGIIIREVRDLARMSRVRPWQMIEGQYYVAYVEPRIVERYRAALEGH